MSDTSKTIVQVSSKVSRRCTSRICTFFMPQSKAYYGDSYIVQDVSFDVNEGEIVALLAVMAQAKHQHCALLRGSMRQNCVTVKFGSKAVRYIPNPPMWPRMQAFSLCRRTGALSRASPFKKTADLAVIAEKKAGLKTGFLNFSHALKSAVSKWAPPFPVVSNKCWPLAAH